MDTDNGFIVGVYHYCDRWCERCTLASRCRVFADQQDLLLKLPAKDSNGAAATSAGEGRDGRPILRSLGALVAAFEELPKDLPEDADAAVADEPPTGRAPLPTAEAALQARVKALGERLWRWLAPESLAHDAEVQDAVDVLQHFAFFIGPKVYRALSGREYWPEADPRSDAIGSAKVALLAFDRIGDAWLHLAERGAISVTEAAPVLTELQALTTELERLFPRARSFVRPGFDEPEAVAMLEWQERG